MNPVKAVSQKVDALASELSTVKEDLASIREFVATLAEQKTEKRPYRKQVPNEEQTQQ